MFRDANLAPYAVGHFWYLGIRFPTKKHIQCMCRTHRTRGLLHAQHKKRIAAGKSSLTGFSVILLLCKIFKKCDSYKDALH